MIDFVLVNSADPHEMPYYATFHLGLHCLGVSILKLVKRVYFSSFILNQNTWTLPHVPYQHVNLCLYFFLFFIVHNYVILGQ